MKAFNLLFALCMFGSVWCTDNDVVGINWSPFHHPDYDSSDSDAVETVMDEDFSRMAESGFNHARTFYSRHGGVWIAPTAQTYGFTLALGVYMYKDYDSWTEKQLIAAADQAEQYPDVVTSILVGNENVRTDGTGDYTVDKLIEYIDYMKELLADRGVTDVKVGTVQRYTEWNSGDSTISELADACDVIGANLYPFYVDIDFDENIDKLESMLSNVQGYFSDKTIWITETGFPSGGSDCSSEQEATVEKTESYFNSIKEWAETNTDTPVFYFQYFDKESADEQDDICNNFFGLASAEGELKFDI